MFYKMDISGLDEVEANKITVGELTTTSDTDINGNLTVLGDITVSGTTTISTVTGNATGLTGEPPITVSELTTTGEVEINNNLTVRGDIIGHGNVGIGTTNPHGKLTIKNDTTDIPTGAINMRNNSQLHLKGPSSGRLSLGNWYQTGNTGSYIQSQDDWELDTINGAKLLLNPYGGNVGIGTESPDTKLHVNGYQTCYNSLLLPSQNTTGGILTPCKITLGNGNSPQILVRYPNNLYTDSTELHFKTGGDNASTDNTISRMVIQGRTGRVGIGTETPAYKLDVRGASATHSGALFRWFDVGGGLFASVRSFNAKIYTDGGIISAGDIGAVSDSRIKKDILEIEDDEALVKLRLLKPCKYKYKNSIQKGNEEVYGFIAQEVKETMSYAVKILPSKEHIPNVYQGGTYTDGIITFPEPHGLTENGDSIKLLVTAEATVIFCPFIIIDTKTIQIDISGLELNIAEKLSNDPIYDEDGNQLDYNIFVYGTEVDDFHILNKSAIWTTGVAALQEVDRQLQAEKAKTATLETQVADLLARVTALENP